jgi:hypothetical protein
MKREEFNIYEFHQLLSQEIHKIPYDKQHLIDMEERLSHTTMYTDELKLTQEIQEYKRNEILRTEFTDFTLLVNPIVQEYNELLNCTIKDSFLKKKKVTTEVTTQKTKLVYQFLKQIEPFVHLSSYLPNFYEEKHHHQLCKDCNIELTTFEHQLICPSCYCEQPMVYNEDVSFKDLSRINTNVKYSYIRQTHFKDTIKQFQGKQNKYIDDTVYQTLVKSFQQAGLHRTDERGHYHKVTKDHIKMFLQENALYKYYEDINLIYQKLSGVLCPDISEYEKQLIYDFERLLVVYDKVIRDESSQYSRTNFLNSYYVLYQLLKKNNFPCKETDFPIIKTIDRKIEHDEIYEKCCLLLGWVFYPTV